jgi:hypothetical protein
MWKFAVTVFAVAVAVAPAAAQEKGGRDDAIRKLEKEVAQLRSELQQLKAQKTGPDRNADRGPGRGSDRATENRANRGPDRNSDRGPGRGPDRATENRANRGPDRMADRGPGRGPDRASGNRADRGPDRRPGSDRFARGGAARQGFGPRGYGRFDRRPDFSRDFGRGQFGRGQFGRGYGYRGWSDPRMQSQRTMGPRFDRNGYRPEFGRGMPGSRGFGAQGPQSRSGFEGRRPGFDRPAPPPPPRGGERNNDRQPTRERDGGDRRPPFIL